MKYRWETQVSETGVSVFEQLAELEAIVGQLTLAALKLPPGAERRDSLSAIGSFRQRIGAIKQSELNRASIMQAVERSG